LCAGGTYNATQPILSENTNELDRNISIDPQQLQSKFGKHASAFGIIGSWNQETARQFQQALIAHVQSADVKRIVGTYHRAPVIHYVNPETGLNVMTDMAGNFISGWKLNPAQLLNVLNLGSL
jgi:hypothetical protein